MSVLFYLIFLLCLCHYLFFFTWNHLNRPVLKNQVFEYDNRIEYVSNCFHKLNASVCGELPDELENRVTNKSVQLDICAGKSGIIVGGHSPAFLEQSVDFESLEKWCSRSLEHLLVQQ